jgi:iron complex transport system substrate-binding protein
LNITSVGKSNAEMMLELHPDLIIGSPSGVGLQQLLGLGIPIFQIYTSDPYQIDPLNSTNLLYSSCELATTLGTILGAEERAADYVNYVKYYADLMTQRIATLSRDQKPTVLFEVFQPYETLVTRYIHNCGGINIAENQTFYYPTMSAEFVIEQNPDIIIRFISSPAHNETDFKAMQDEILARPELAKTSAIINKKVYIMDWSGFGGGANFYDVVGYLQWAKWIQPTLFSDIKPADVQSYLSQEFFGNATLREGVYWYPVGGSR